VFGTYGFGEIRPPIIESTELFARAVGGETDIVSKEMYGFPKKLEILRRATTDLVGQVDTPAKIHVFGQALAVLVLNLGQALEGAVIPTTQTNRHLVEQLKEISGRTIARWRAGQWEPSQQWTNDFETARALIDELEIERLEESSSLRPEATASVCRAYIEHNMQQLPAPVKLYYTGPMFRRERPQKGRYRQFYQIGAEVLGGSDAPGIDAEVIEMVMVYFAKLELPGVQLEINSIGCRDCRPKYVELLRAELQKVKDRLGTDSQRRIETNPLRVLDSKLEHEQAIIETLPRIGEHLCADCAKHYAEVKRQLGMRGVAYKETWRLVRGLDYYMRTTFEITARGLGSQNAVCGGGRYDGLIELLGGPPTKGIGFAIGEDRVILSLLEAGKGNAAEGRDVYIAWMGEKAQATAIAAARTLREAGFRVELPPVEQKFGKALGQADKLGARYALILGEDEVASGEWTLKTLADGSQKKIAKAELVKFLREAKRDSSLRSE
ncbi:MAG TPA: histidine--tRNA ligase, partial [Candidatus Limnocylindrales bacterium]|nr:histidine--tRNA ligase [Candidatus Limnocylindrales bacterium]